MYRILRGEMAKYDLTIEKTAAIIGVSATTMSKKLNGRVEFLLSEAKKLLDYFNERGNDYTIEYLFFTDVSTKVI